MSEPHPTLPRSADRAGSPWMPWTPCTPRCVPADLPLAGRIRVAIRLVALPMVLLTAMATSPALFVLGVPGRGRWLRWFCRAALRAAGVRHRVSGPRRYAEGGALVVSNHTSWIDVLALNAVQPVRLLAKHEVRDWPLIGGLAVRTGALFVDRAGLRALPATVAETAGALRDGAAVGVFPEGTTWCGTRSGPFHRAAFQAAIDARVPVAPVAIVLRLPDGTSTPAAGFLGAETLWDALRRVLLLPGVVCDVTVLPLVEPSPGLDRRELAERARSAITAVTRAPGTITPARPSPPSPGRADDPVAA